MEALFLKDVKAISSAGRRRSNNNKSSPNSRSRSSTSQIIAIRTSPTRKGTNEIPSKDDNKSASSSNNCSGSSSKRGKRIQSSSTNDTSTLSEKTKRIRMSPKLKKLDSLATSSPSSQRIFEGDISPMDYRPQQKRRRNKKKNHKPNVAVDNDTIIDKSNGMLKEYVDQWTKSSSPPTNSTRKREIKNNVVTTENNDKQDSSSASVISTSSHSAVDNNDYEGIVKSEGGEVVNDKDIELEYGQLAFMKKDLERKMRLYQQGSTCITSTTPRNNKTVEENNKLEVEYGKLSFMKQELEHKMSIYKMDAEKIDHPLSSTTRKEAPTREFHAPPSSSSRNVMMDGESRMLVSASKNAINIESPDNHDLAAPSRQDVEFGARAFQRIMSERRRLPRVEDVGVATTTTELYQVPHKKRRLGYQYNGDEHNDNDNDDDYSVKHLGDSKSRSIHRCDEKKKRKRKRRVVETRVIRVFHEESEEAESGSTSTSPSYRTSKRLDYGRRQQGMIGSYGLKHTSMSKEEKHNRMKNNKKSSPSSVSGSRGRRNKQMRAKSQSSMLEGLS